MLYNLNITEGKSFYDATAEKNWERDNSAIIYSLDCHSKPIDQMPYCIDTDENEATGDWLTIFTMAHTV